MRRPGPAAGSPGPGRPSGSDLPTHCRPQPWVLALGPTCSARGRFHGGVPVASPRPGGPSPPEHKEGHMPEETHQPTVEELKAKAYQPMEDAMKLHPFYKGKIETTLKCCVRDFQDFGIWYTPGVSKPCLDIKDDPEKVYEHTNKGNTVAVISDGTRVLGLGDIGARAGLPVMEGKSLLFRYLGGVDGFPLMIDSKDPDDICRVVKLLQPGRCHQGPCCRS